MALWRGVVRHLDEAEATDGGVTIGNDIDLVHRPIRFEELAKVLSCGIERNIADINIHARVSCEQQGKYRQVIEQYAEAQNAKHDAGETA